MQYIFIGIKYLIATVFLTSSVGKLLREGAFEAFSASLRGLGFTARVSAFYMALCVLGIEVLACVLIVVPSTSATGLLIASIALAIFTIVIAITVYRGKNATCRCFGTSSFPLSFRHIVRNAILFAIAISGAAISPYGNGYTEINGVILAVIAGIFLGLLVTVFDDIAELFKPINKSVKRAP